MFIIVNSAKYNRQENAALFREMRRYIFRIPELFRAFSADTAVLKAAWTVYLTMMHRGKLPFAIKEIVALMTSEVNNCQYCADLHRVFLTASEQSNIKAHDTLFGEQRTESYRRHLRHFIYKVVRQHSDLNDVDISQYKDVFRTDNDRLEAVLLMSAITFFTTFADAAGVNLEFIPDDTPARRNLMKAAVRQSRKKRLQHADPFYVRFEDLYKGITGHYDKIYGITPPPMYEAFKEMPMMLSAYWELEKLLTRKCSISQDLIKRIVRYVTAIVHSGDPILTSVHSGWSNLPLLEEDKLLEPFVKTMVFDPFNITEQKIDRIRNELQDEQIFDLVITVSAVIARGCMLKAVQALI